ncbi:hypothetical protein F5Y07DRAFT_193901 [Xylaria sp. FL0933]|nr:hypothetical protein F5Y07DRAFT_193901 [Xylaria sp. FL0933]
MRQIRVISLEGLVVGCELWQYCGALGFVPGQVLLAPARCLRFFLCWGDMAWEFIFSGEHLRFLLASGCRVLNKCFLFRNRYPILLAYASQRERFKGFGRLKTLLWCDLMFSFLIRFFLTLLTRGCVCHGASATNTPCGSKVENEKSNIRSHHNKPHNHPPVPS